MTGLGFSPKRRLDRVVVYEFRDLPMLDDVLEFFEILDVEVDVENRLGFDSDADALVYVCSPGIAARALRLQEKGEDPVVMVVTPTKEVMCLSGHHWGGDELSIALAGWLGGRRSGLTTAEAESRPSAEDVLDVIGVDPRRHRDEIVEIVEALERGVWIEKSPHPGLVRYLKLLGVKAWSREKAGLVVDPERGEIVELRGGDRGQAVRGRYGTRRSGPDDG
ncbi:hypothetical protein [Methanopyrus sp.]